MSLPASAEPASAEGELRKRPLRRRVKKALRRWLMGLGLYTVPYLYVAYMWLVYRTSRVEELGLRPDLLRERHGRGIYAIWHDEVFFVAYAFGRYRPDTLASRGDAGSVIARMLELCGFNVFRGGSSSGAKRRSTEIVEEMIAHMKAKPGVLYGITTDGSQGPVYRMKRGAVSIAVATGAPLAVEKTWCRRYLRLPTWDRTLLPLPFNRIVHVYAGPVWPPPAAASDPARFEALRDELERLLCRVSAYTRARAEGRPPPDDWIALFPERHRADMVLDEPPALFLD